MYTFDMKRFYTTSEVAKMCQVASGSIVRWIHEGKLKAASTPGGHHRIDRQQVLSLLSRLGMPLPPELEGLENEIQPPALKILLVEDDSGMRTWLREFLKQNFPDASVDEAIDGFAAGWKANGIKPDLVILDLMLPGMSGYEVCRLIRGLPELSHTRILALSGFEDGKTEQNVLDSGANAFLAKPFAPEALRAKISEQIVWLRGAAA